MRKVNMVLGGELHADEEAMLLESGSKQADLWGINLYLDHYGTNQFIEYDTHDNNKTCARAKITAPGALEMPLRAQKLLKSFTTN